MHPLFDMSSDYGHSPAIFYPPAPRHFFPQDECLQSPMSQWTPAPVSAKSAAAAATPPPPPPPVQRPSITTNPSRKRSRDDFDDEEWETPSLTASSSASSSSCWPSSVTGMDIVEEPVLGEGMTLIDPATGRSLAAESQTGTWYEENIEAERQVAALAAAELEREKLEARGRPAKSVRLDSPTPAASSNSDTTLTTNNTLSSSTTTSYSSLILQEQPLAATPTPVIDEASMMLGIGWKAVGGGDDADLQCAARGWARYIENHYPLLGAAEILCKSEGLEAFLVKAAQPAPAFWLFKDDLSEGRLVSSSSEGLVQNLRSVPVVFEGSESLFAAAERTPAGAVGETAWAQAEQQIQIEAVATPLPNQPLPVAAAAAAAVGGASDDMMF